MYCGIPQEYTEKVVMFERGIFTGIYQLIMFDFEEWDMFEDEILGLHITGIAPKWMCDFLGRINK